MPKRKKYIPWTLSMLMTSLVVCLLIGAISGHFFVKEMGDEIIGSVYKYRLTFLFMFFPFFIPGGLLIIYNYRTNKKRIANTTTIDGLFEQEEVIIRPTFAWISMRSGPLGGVSTSAFCMTNYRLIMAYKRTILGFSKISFSSRTSFYFHKVTPSTGLLRGKRLIDAQFNLSDISSGFSQQGGPFLKFRTNMYSRNLVCKIYTHDTDLLASSIERLMKLKSQMNLSDLGRKGEIGGTSTAYPPLNSPIPGAQKVLKLAFLSIFFSMFGIGWIFAIIALFASREPFRLYRANPDKYDNYNALKLGRIIALAVTIFWAFSFVLLGIL